MPADEDVGDEAWLTLARSQGWIVFMKDARIRHNPVERSAVLRHSVRCFCLTGQSLPADEIRAGAGCTPTSGSLPRSLPTLDSVHLTGSDGDDMGRFLNQESDLRAAPVSNAGQPRRGGVRIPDPKLGSDPYRRPDRPRHELPTGQDKLGSRATKCATSPSSMPAVDARTPNRRRTSTPTRQQHAAALTPQLRPRLGSVRRTV